MARTASSTGMSVDSSGGSARASRLGGLSWAGSPTTLTPDDSITSTIRLLISATLSAAQDGRGGRGRSPGTLGCAFSCFTTPTWTTFR